MTNLKFYTLDALPELKNFVRRVLITESEAMVEEQIPIGPTGFCYLTYSRFPISLQYRQRLISSDNKLYLAGQIKEEQPFLKVEGAMFHVGLELYPLSLYYFFGIAGPDLLDDSRLLSDFDPTMAENCLASLAAAKTGEEAALILQKQLIKKLHKIKPLTHLEKVLELIYANKGKLEISKLFNQIDLSERHIRRQFNKVVGLSVKRYCKVVQFNAVFEAICQGNEKQIYDWALLCGYYDDAHFINDFRATLGQSPQKFLKSEHDFLKTYLGSLK